VRRRTPSFKGLSAASLAASRIAIAASAKRDTSAELTLRHALRGTGLRYKVDVASLPGHPDLVIPAARLAIFCDGDFWHGRHLRRRLQRLATGNNAAYWTAKIKSNVARDRRIKRALQDSGWTVLRLWESDVRADPLRAAETILRAARVRRKPV
jgi:DNA mismatch endonuclease, patch repair protein